MNLELLEQAGLTKNESLVYKALLELGPSLAGQISRKSGLHRRTVYDTTEMLIKKGLIGYILQNNRRLFQASSPNRFLEMIKEKENEISEFLPEMLDLYAKTREKEQTNFYKGKEGLKAVFQDQLEDNKEVLILGASNSAFEILPFYFKWYDKDRIKKRVKVRMIAYEKMSKKIPLAEIRYLSQEHASPMAINIYKDKVSIILWKNPPVCILIKDKQISEGYRKHFELMWSASRK
jgi:sugar-specific transcriptional regulator TrmB